MKRFYKAEAFTGYRDIVGETDPLLKYLAFSKLILPQGQRHEGYTGGYETALVLLSGAMTVTCGDKRFGGLTRKNVFEEKGVCVYLPCQTAYSVVADQDADIAVCKVKAESRFEPFAVGRDDVVVHKRGKESWNREVHDLIADAADGKVQRMVLGETFGAPGQWSSYPPHKHDGEHAPIEPNMEEIYHFQVNPAQGFGVQLHYTKDGSIDDAYMVRNGDTFAIDVGYHPVAAAGGYQVYYLWFMAGEEGRQLVPFDDPDHKWVK